MPFPAETAEGKTVLIAQIVGADDPRDTVFIDTEGTSYVRRLASGSKKLFPVERPEVQIGSADDAVEPADVDPSDAAAFGAEFVEEDLDDDDFTDDDLEDEDEEDEDDEDEDEDDLVTA